jgi:polar amino acid transport system permease protein
VGGHGFTPPPINTFSNLIGLGAPPCGADRLRYHLTKTIVVAIAARKVRAPGVCAKKTVVAQAEAVRAAHRAVGRAQAREALEHQFKISRIVAEAHASRASLERGADDIAARSAGDKTSCAEQIHRARFSQCAANTTAESKNPNDTLIATPELKARNGRVPACESSRKRVVKPMLRKQKMNAGRCIPFLLLTYIVYFGLPAGRVVLDKWSAALATLVLYNTAYMAEILRAGWASLPPGQTEAARACGYHGLLLTRRIILPQLVIAVGPVIGNQLIQLIKDSAFLSIITVPELTFAANAVQSYYFVPFESFLVATLLYWALCAGIEGLWCAAARSGLRA